MFLQTGGGGKGIRPNQQHQQQQHHHQSHHQSHHQTHHPHAPQQQPQQQQSVHLGHPAPQQTHSHHPHQQTQQQPPQQQQQQQQHHHPPPSLSYYPYQLSQAPPQPPAHPSAPNNAVTATQMAPSPPTQATSAAGVASSVPVTQSHSLVGGGGASVAGGNSSSATNIARQHAAAAAAAAAVAGGNANLQHYSAGAALMQPPPTSTAFMTTTYIQQYHQQSAAVIAAAAAAAQYNNNAVAAAAAANNHSGPGNGPTASTLYQQQQQQHHQTLHHPQAPLHTHYYHPSAGAAPTPPPHLHPHHHPAQHQLRGVITAPPHPRQPQTAYLLPPNAIFALPPGPLTAAPRTTGNTGAAMPVTPLLQSSSRTAAGGPTAYITSPFCQPPLPMGAAGLTPPQPLLATPASMAQQTLQTYGHLTGAATSSSSSSTSLTAAGTGSSGSGGTGGNSNTTGVENVKQRKYAIPIIHPITHENILDPKPQKKSATVEAKPSATDITGGAEQPPESTQSSGGATTKQIKEADKSITVSIPKTLPATLTTTSALDGDSAKPVQTTSSKEKIDQQMQTDAARDRNASSRRNTYEPHASDSAPAVCALSDDECDCNSADLKMTRTELDSDGNETYMNDEEDLTVVDDQLAANASVSACSAISATSANDDDDGESNYDEVESISMVDIVDNDPENDEVSEDFEETRDAQRQQQDTITDRVDKLSQNQDDYDKTAGRFEAVPSLTALSVQEEKFNVSAQTQRATGGGMYPLHIAQRPKSTQNLNATMTTTSSNISILTTTATPLSGVASSFAISPALATPKTQLKSSKSVISTAIGSNIGGAGIQLTLGASNKATSKYSPTTSVASSTASTPTHHQQHQQQQQQQQQLQVQSQLQRQQQQQQQHQHQHQQQQQQQQKKTHIISNSNAGVGAVVAGSAVPANSKKNRKASKRAKESQKKLKQSDNNNRCSSATSSNNNNNNVKGATNVGNSVNNNLAAALVTSSITPTAHTNILTDMNNANSYSENNSSNNRSNLRDTTSTANLRQQQQHHHHQNQHQQQQRSGNNSKSGSLERTNLDTKSDSPLDDVASIGMHPAQSLKHMKTQEIVAQYLQEPSAGKTLEEQQLQFLNSSSSACEDEEEINARLQLHLQQQDATASAAAVQDLRFGDYVEEKENTELSKIKVNPSAVKVNANKTKSANIDTVDCVANMNLGGSALNLKNSTGGIRIMNKVFNNSNNAAINTAAGAGTGATGIANVVLMTKPHRYTLEELKALSKSSEARKPPLITCQKGDCISQLFVSRQQHHHLSHHAHNMSSLALHQHLQQQQYQHMNFNESMELVTGKRRGGQAKKHHEHQSGGVSGIVNVGGGSGTIGGVIGGGSGNNSAQQQRKVDFIRVQLSLKEEIKLSECENAWQPETLRNKSTSTSPSGINSDIDSVLKKVRGVLNKLTPDNFDVLLKTMTSISMNTLEKMQQVMLLIFEKTVSEPNFAPTYAKFCKVLFQEIKAESKSLFSNSLITRIQQEFETNVNNADAKKVKLQPLVDRLETCTDPKERLELQAELEDQEYQFRRRAWGTVRFIGEMYKLQSLTSDRVFTCIESLLEHGCEEKLEYMCKLLTTVGHLLEGTSPEHYVSNARMDKIFRKIQEIVHKSRNSNNKNGQPKISSRVRFMMQDVMDLRSRCWDQPQPQAQQQQSQQRRTSMVTKQEEKMQGSGGNSGGSMNMYEKNSNRMGYGNQNNPRQSRDGHYFQQKSQKSQFMQQQEQQKLNIDVNKLKFTSDEVTQSTPKLGSSHLYLWRTPGRQVGPGGSIGTNAPTTILNMNTASHVPSSNNSGFKRQSTSSGPTLMPTNQFQALDKTDRIQLQLNDQCSGSVNDLKGMHIVDDDMPDFSNKECQNLMNRLIEEVLDASASNSWQQEVEEEWRNTNQKQQKSLINYLLMDYLHLAAVKRAQRKACAMTFVHLIRTKVFDKQLFTQVYSQLSDEFPDLLVDVPNLWTYVFEFLGPLLHEHLLHFNDIWLPQWAEDIQFTKRFLKAMIAYFTSEFGATYMRDLWHKEFKLDRGQEFMSDPAQWQEFISANGFQYIYERNCKPPQADLAKTSHHSVAEQIERIEFLLKTANGCDLAIDYINTNVYINTNFVRHLTKFLCCDYATVMPATSNTMITAPTASATDSNSSPTSNIKRQLNSELFRHKCIPLLRRCLDGRESHEIACLDVIVDAMQQFYDEATANQLIFSVFDIIYDNEVLPKESFDKWYRAQLSAQDADINNARADAGNVASASNGSGSCIEDKLMLPFNESDNALRTSIKSESHSQTFTRKANSKEGPRLNEELHAYMEKLL